MKNFTCQSILKNALVTVGLSIFGAFSFNVINAFAGSILPTNPYGTEITIYDKIGTNGIGSFKEDNEAEPGMVQSQSWDLEGFLLKQKNLSIVSGYNFYTGNEGYMAGDIFISTKGNAISSVSNPNTIPGFDYGPTYWNPGGTHTSVGNDKFKYDYVLAINWLNSTYNVVKLDNNSVFLDTIYGNAYNKTSNPWRYLSGGSIVNTSPLAFTAYNKASLNDTGYDGWIGTEGAGKHYVATFDISSIDLSNGALFHNTMECGNDNLIGQIAPVPEPSTFLLLGIGLLGAVMVRRKISK